VPEAKYRQQWEAEAMTNLWATAHVNYAPYVVSARKKAIPMVDKCEPEQVKIVVA
jgi:hypothetical protein